MVARVPSLQVVVYLAFMASCSSQDSIQMDYHG